MNVRDPDTRRCDPDVAALERRVRQAEAALRTSEARAHQRQLLLDAMTSAAGLLIATVDLELRYTYFNREHHEELYRLTGKTTAIGVEMGNVLADMPEALEVVLAIWRRALAGETIEQTLEFGDPRRYRRWYAARHSPIRDARGRIVGAGEVSMDITERMLAQRELQAQSAILSGVTDGVMLVAQEERRIVYTNMAFDSLFGYQHGELLGRDPSILNAPDLRTPVDIASAIVADAMASGCWQGDVCNLRKDGTTFWTHAAITSHDIPPWGPVWMCVQRDVSERKRQEGELNRQRLLLESITQSTDVLLVLVDRGFDVVWVNKAFSRVTRMRPEDLVGRNYFDLFPDAETQTIYSQVLATGDGAFRKDAPYVIPDRPQEGVTYWDWSLVAIREEQGGISGLLMSVRETTPYKRTELALTASEERYRSLVEQVSDGIFITDQRGRYLDFNEVGAAMFGRTRGEILCLNTYDLLAPEEHARVPVEIARLTDGGVTRTEWRLRRKDGSVFIGEVQGRRLPDGRYQGVLRDISSRRLAESQRLADMARQRDTLVREVHHRIKNHLHGVMGLLSEKGRCMPEVAQPLADVSAQIDAIATVYGLQATCKPFQVELRQLITLLVDGLADSETVQLHAEDVSDVFLAETVSVPIALVINELLVNARKHRLPADPRRPLRVTLARSAHGVRLEVCSGPARWPSGFDFERGHGIGLGLELVATMLPSSASRLVFEQRGDETCAVLRIGPAALRGPSYDERIQRGI